MRIAAICLALAALPALSEPRLARVAPITLYVDFKEQPPQAVLDAIEDELAKIMSPIGLHFDWTPLASSRGKVSVELAVVTFKGRCDAAHLKPLPSNPGPLGWTHVSDGAVLPFSDIDCEGIRSFIQTGLLRLEEVRRGEAFGRAVGRVLAHELYHVFANTRQHGTEGIAKASYTVQELLSPIFHFEEPDSEALRGSDKAKTLLEVAAGP